MFGTITGIVVGACASNLTGLLLGKEIVKIAPHIGKFNTIAARVGAVGCGMVVGNAVSREVEKSINEFTGDPNHLSD